MTSNHTPGPWEVVDESSKYAEIIGESRYVGRVYKWHHPTVICPANNALAEEHAANARLIAAAPCMLEALQKVRNCIASTSGPIPCDPSNPEFLAYVDGICDEALAKAAPNRWKQPAGGERVKCHDCNGTGDTKHVPLRYCPACQGGGWQVRE